MNKMKINQAANSDKKHWFENNFYKNLSSFKSFEEVTLDSHYKKLPNSWFVVITDIKGSTKAIDEGRYKDVNVIGAACIAAVQDTINCGDFPFVFGGDGASFLIEPKYIKEVTSALLKVKNLAKNKFKIDLRVGVVPVSKLENAGQIIKVAKFQLAETKCVAKIKGGGLTYSENLIKSHPDLYNIEQTSDEEISLHNLSCRWKAIPSANGKILTLMIKTKNNLYNGILKELHSIVGNDYAVLNPVKPSQMIYESFFTMVKYELMHEPGLLKFETIRRFFEILLCTFLFQKKKLLKKKINTYSNTMASHSDFRKFDDTLRMVIDCTEDQISKIKTILYSQHKDGLLEYGTFVSDSALMTCLVKSLDPGNHIHFIDGNNGGYAMAAKEYKEQKKATEKDYN